MNTLNGYSKSTLTDNFVLTAAGGHLAVGNASNNIPLNNSTVNTNLNADLLDGTHKSELLTVLANVNTTDNPQSIYVTVGDTTKYLKVDYSQHSVDLVNTSVTDPASAASGQYLKWYSQINRFGSDPYYAGTNTGFPVVNNANGILWLGTRSGTYGGLLGVSGNNRLYYRFITNNTFPTTANGGSWNRIAWSSEVDALKDYYWANIKISSASSTTTKPTFATATATTSVITPLVFSTDRLTLNATNTGLDLKFNNDNTKSVILDGTAFKPFNDATGKLTLGSTSARWSNIYATNLLEISNPTGGSDIGTKIIGKDYSIGFIIGSGNTNGGIYDYTNSKWILCLDSGSTIFSSLSKFNAGIAVTSTAYFGGLVIIKGTVENKPLVVRGIVGYDGSANIAELYLQYGADNAIYLGNTGAYTISKDGSTYSGAAAKLSVNGGSISKPVYFANGIPTEVTSIDNSLINVTDGTSTLAWDTENTLATIAGQEIKAKLPSNPNTDTKVKLDIITSNTLRPIVLGYNDINSTTSITDLVYYSSKIYVNPSNGSLCLTDTGGLVLKADSGDPPQIRFMRGNSTDAKIDWALAGSRIFQIRYSISGSDFINVFETASNLVTISTPLTVKNIFEATSNSVTMFKPLTVNDVITSTVSLGTAPLIINSTTKVNNLNADLLDGYNSDDFVLKSNMANEILNEKGCLISIYGYSFDGRSNSSDNVSIYYIRGIEAKIENTANSITFTYARIPNYIIYDDTTSTNPLNLDSITVSASGLNSSLFYTGLGKIIIFF